MDSPRYNQEIFCKNLKTFGLLACSVPCSLADCMRRMEFDAWLGMMEHLFAALLEHLQTVQV